MLSLSAQQKHKTQQQIYVKVEPDKNTTIPPTLF